jgi:NADPH2:quinone reductase
MRAVVIDKGGLSVEQRPDPEPGEGQLLVEVQAAGLNGADLAQRAGSYPAPPGAPPDIPGMECAGTVVATGPGVSIHATGDRVMSIVGGGAQAELCLVDDVTALLVPPTISWAEAGGFPEVFTTAHDALVSQCGLVGGERLLVTGAAGGVGLAAIQLGRMQGAEVVASVHRPEMAERVREIGANTVISPEQEADAGPYDVVIELVGAARVPAHLRALNTAGRIVVIGISGTGPTAELDLRYLMMKRAVLRGSTLRARSREQKAATARALAEKAIGWLASGAIRVPVESTYRLGEVEAAYERFGAGAKFGKVVLVR